ncbi:MAG: 4-alpha-glucanotransferase, partial [Verrucomicrobiales bacterium]
WRPTRNAEFLPLSAAEARERTGDRLPGFRPRPDDTKENRAANLADGDGYLRAVQEAAGESVVIGEDLGEVPDYVRPHLEKRGIAGFKVCHWEYELDEDDAEAEPQLIPGSAYAECSFATYATHDHPPLAAMWEEFREKALSADEDERLEGEKNLRLLGEFAGISPLADQSWPGYTPELRDKLLRALFACRSRYAALMITDIYGLPERFNTPGTVGGTNWRVRLPFTIREMRERPDLRAAGASLAAMIRESGRAR